MKTSSAGLFLKLLRRSSIWYRVLLQTKALRGILLYFLDWDEVINHKGNYKIYIFNNFIGVLFN